MMILQHSVTSRLETSRYRDFFLFFESVGIGLGKFGLKKSLSISLENIWFKKSLGMTHSQMFQKVESG